MWELIGIDPRDAIIWGSALAAFLSVAAVALPFLRPDARAGRMRDVANRRQELSRQQLDNLSNRSRKPSARSKANQELMKRVLSQLKLDDKLSSKKIKAQLQQAGFRGQQAMVNYIFMKVAGIFVGAIATFLGIQLFGEKMNYDPSIQALFIAGGAVAGFYLPTLMVVNMAQKRQQDMNQTFPDALDLLVICVESGLGVEQAFDKVTEEIAESSPVLAQEFGITTAELAYLGDRHKAYENMATRSGMPSFRSLATTLQQSEKYGTPVGVALRVLSQERREERMSMAEKKGAALPAKLTVPMIVFFLPLLFMVVLGPAIIQVMEL